MSLAFLIAMSLVFTCDEARLSLVNEHLQGLDLQTQDGPPERNNDLTLDEIQQRYPNASYSPMGIRMIDLGNVFVPDAVNQATIVSNRPFVPNLAPSRRLTAARLARCQTRLKKEKHSPRDSTDHEPLISKRSMNVWRWLNRDLRMIVNNEIAKQVPEAGRTSGQNLRQLSNGILKPDN